MKKLKFIILAFTFLAIGSLGMVLLPSKAEAAAAQCFKLQGNPARPRPINCNTLIGAPLPAGDGTGFLPAQGPSGANSFLDNKCYLQGWGIIVANAGSPDCRAWRNGRVLQDSPNSPNAANDNDDTAQPGSNPALPAGDGSLEEPTRETQAECDGGDCINDNYIVMMTKWAINILSALVGVVVVGVIVFAGIEYSSSAGDPAKTAAAKSRIINAIIALAAYMFLYIILQWLIPGGLFP